MSRVTDHDRRILENCRRSSTRVRRTLLTATGILDPRTRAQAREVLESLGEFAARLFERINP